VSADDYKHLEWWDVMKIGGAAKKAKNMYVKDENPALRAVIAGLKKVVKELVPGTKETVNAWGVPTFVAQNPFAFDMVGKKARDVRFSVCDITAGSGGIVGRLRKKHAACEVAHLGGFG